MQSQAWIQESLGSLGYNSGNNARLGSKLLLGMGDLGVENVLQQQRLVCYVSINHQSSFLDPVVKETETQ